MSAPCMVIESNNLMQLHSIILYSIHFHTSMLAHSYSYIKHQLSLCNARIVSFYRYALRYTNYIVEFNIIIFCKDHHDYFCHSLYHHYHQHFLFSCLLSSLLLQYGFTALHLACRDGILEIVSLLLDKHANMEAKTEVRNLMMIVTMVVSMMV